MAKSYKYFIFAALSGVLLALAYPGWPASWRINLDFLVWVGLVPLFYALNPDGAASDYDRGGIRSSRRLKRFFLAGFVAGLVYFLIVLRWFWSVHPLDTMGIQSRLASLVIVFLIHIISSAGMAVFWGLFGLAYSLWLIADSNKNSSHRLLSIGYWLAIPATFVLLEYARSWGFGILWAGSGTLFGPHWTLGNLAYALAGNNLALKLSSYVGIYGVSFFIVFSNFLFFKVVKNRTGDFRQIYIWRRSSPNVDLSPLGAAIIVLIIFSIAFWPRSPNQKILSLDKKINFAIIQTNQPTKISQTPNETLNIFKEQLNLLKLVAKEHPESQLIIFPEASDFFKNLSLFLTGAQVPNYFSNLFKEPRLIVSGARIVDADGRAYSRVFALDTKEDIIDFYDKRLLTPQGEFLSYPTKFIVNLLSKTKVSEFGALRELSVGKGKVSTVSFRDQFSVAPLVCSEILSPSLARKTTRGADIIVGMASYGVFRGSAALVKQNLAIAQFRAAENRKPLIAASNMGLSYATDSDGNIVKIAPNQASQILTGGIALNPGKSWYNKIGDTPILVGCLGLVAIVFSVQWLVLRRLVFDKNSKP